MCGVVGVLVVQRNEETVEDGSKESCPERTDGV